MLENEQIKHYIEFFYPYNPDRGNQEDFSYFQVITNRDPLLYIKNYNGAIGFRFFDIDNFDLPLNIQKRKNISPIYYYGRYMNKQELEQIHKIMPFTINIQRMIQCYSGDVITNLNENDITIEEYINSLNYSNKQQLKMTKTTFLS